MRTPDTLNLDRLVTHVVAWHNRHPLASRIDATRVHSVGYVAVPFELAPGLSPPPGDAGAPPETSGTLRERAMARALPTGNDGPDYSVPLDAAIRGPAHPADLFKPDDLGPAFDESFLKPVSVKKLAAWVATQGVSLRAPRRDVPVRRIQAAARSDPTRLVWRWVLTAQVDLDGRRARVLLGAGSSPALIGRRLMSPGRIAGVVAVAVALAVGGAWLLGRLSAQPGLGNLPGGLGAGQAPVAAAASLPGVAGPQGGASAAPRAPSAPVAASAPAAQPAPVVASAPAAKPAPAAAAAAAAASQPADVEPRLGQVELPSLGPRIDERRRQQREAASAAASPSATATAGPAATPSPVMGPAWAVWTRVVRTRSESTQMADAMRGLLSAQTPSKLRVEAMPAGDDWRVVSYPFATREQAERARELLASRGMRVEVVEF